jgi:hypothetical protein
MHKNTGRKYEGKGSLGRPRRRREDITGLKEIGCEVVDWMQVA